MSGQRRAILAAILAMPLLALGACSESEAPVSQARPVRVMEIQPASQSAAATYSGVVSPRVEADLAFRVAGRVAKRSVDIGALVKAGDTLAQLDPTPFRLAVAEASAALAETRSNAVEASRDLKRNRALTDRGVVSRASLESLGAAADAALARVKQAESRLEIARNDEAFAALVAPADGVVTDATIEAGQYVQPGQSAFRVARLDQLDVTLDIPETRIAGLRQGAGVEIELASQPGTVIAGTVREVSPSADPATRTFRVKVAFPATANVRLGMTVVARIQTGTGPLVELPLSSLTQMGSDPAVWTVIDGSRLELRAITIGTMGSDRFTVTAGLSAGDKVVTAGVHRLDAGLAVRIWDGALP